MHSTVASNKSAASTLNDHNPSSASLASRRPLRKSIYSTKAIQVLTFQDSAAGQHCRRRPNSSQPPTSHHHTTKLACCGGKSECDHNRCNGSASSASHHNVPSEPSAPCAELAKPTGPILTLSPHAVALLDPSDLESVYSLWTVFSKCSAVLENGKRLENISWRLWNKELLANPQQDQKPSLYQTKTKSGSEGSVPDLNQVPILSSSVESSTSSCTMASNQKGSHDKLNMTKATTLASPSQGSSLYFLEATRPVQAPKVFSSLTEQRNKPSAKQHHSKQISSTRLAKLLSLFHPDHQDSFTKFKPGPKHPSQQLKHSSTAPKQLSTPEIASHMDSTTRSSHEERSVRPVHHSLSSEPSNARRHTSLFKPAPPLPRRDSQPTPQHLHSMRLPLQPQDHSLFKNPPTVHPEHTAGLLRTRSNTNANTQIAEGPAKLQRSSSLFQTPKEQSKRTASLFPHTTIPPSTKKEVGLTRNRSHVYPTDSHNVITKEVHSNFSDSSAVDSDTDADSDSASEFEGIDSNGSRLTFRHRTSTSTSIVRGFSPSPAVSVSVSRRNSSIKQETPAAKIPAQPSGLLEMTKARPDKVARANMFFIESSSPSDNELGLGSSFSQNSTYSSPQKHSGSSRPTSVTSTDRSTSLFDSRSDLNKQYSVVHNHLTGDLLPSVDEKDTDDENDDDFDDDEDDENDSAWDSLDDESDSDSFEVSGFARDETPRPLMRPSLLSSLFLNNPEKLQEHHSKTAQAAKQMVQHETKNASAVTSHVSPTTEIEGHPHPIAAVAPASKLLSNVQASSQPSIEIQSPRTTRRNMLASELSESVRRDLLWERKQIGVWKPAQTDQRASSNKHGDSLMRRHTSVDLTGLNRANGLSQQLQEDDSLENGITEDGDESVKEFIDYDPCVW